MRSTARRTGLDRLRPVLVLALAVGLVGYVLSVCFALTAGGLSTSAQLGTCAEAATGTFRTTYRMSESLTVEHGFLPPSATCRWSGGTSAVLVPGTWTWSGVVVVAVAALGLVAVHLATRVRGARVRG